MSFTFISKIVYSSTLVASFLVTSCLSYYQQALGAYKLPHEGASKNLHVDFSSIQMKQILTNPSIHTPSMGPELEEAILSDHLGRLHSEFNIPSHLRAQTQFWFNIYAKYSSRQVLIYDEIHQDIVYEVVDLNDLIPKSRNSIAFALNSRKRLFDRINLYRKVFSELQERKNPSNREIAQRILAATKHIRSHKHSTPHTFSELSNNLRLQTGHKDGVLKAISLSTQYLPRMEEIFRQQGLPTELTRLTIVESSFNLEAVSTAGAKGIWQFLEASAQEYIHVNEEEGIDERRSPLKSTLAAAQLLKRNRQLLPSWLLAVTAYHHGYRTFMPFASVPVSMNQQIETYFAPCSKNGGPKLGWASRNYYSQFLAVLYAEAYKEFVYGVFPSMELEPISVVKLSKGTTAVSFILEVGISVSEFERLNPDVLNLQAYLPENFSIVLPYTLAKSYLDLNTDIPRLGPVQTMFKLDAGILAVYSDPKKNFSRSRN